MFDAIPVSLVLSSVPHAVIPLPKQQQLATPAAQIRQALAPARRTAMLKSDTASVARTNAASVAPRPLESMDSIRSARGNSVLERQNTRPLDGYGSPQAVACDRRKHFPHSCRCSAACEVDAFSGAPTEAPNLWGVAWGSWLRNLAGPAGVRVRVGEGGCWGKPRRS